MRGSLSLLITWGYKTSLSFVKLIKTFVEIDKDGMQLRYAKDLDGKEYKPTPTFVKADLIIKDTQLNNSLKAIEKIIIITYKNLKKIRKNKLIIKSSNKRKWKYLIQ